MEGFLRDEEGQAIVEYVLILSVTLMVVGLIAAGFRRMVLFLWQQITCDVTAACPGCPADPGVKNQIFPGACR